jgi:hypothetical protein
MSEYTDKNFTSSDWGLIQDCIVDQISHLKEWQKYGYEEEVERLEKMLERVGRKYAQTRVN